MVDFRRPDPMPRKIEKKERGVFERPIECYDIFAYLLSRGSQPELTKR
jgi:hypothetical protein